MVDEMTHVGKIRCSQRIKRKPKKENSRTEQQQCKLAKPRLIFILKLYARYVSHEM